MNDKDSVSLKNQNWTVAIYYIESTKIFGLGKGEKLATNLQLTAAQSAKDLTKMVQKSKPSTTSYLWIVQPYLKACGDWQSKMPADVKKQIDAMATLAGVDLATWSGQILYSPNEAFPNTVSNLSKNSNNVLSQGFQLKQPKK